jgi:hypothetical protein
MYSEWRSGAFSRAAAGFTGTSEIVAAEQPGVVLLMDKPERRQDSRGHIVHGGKLIGVGHCPGGMSADAIPYPRLDPPARAARRLKVCLRAWLGYHLALRAPWASTAIPDQRPSPHRPTKPSAAMDRPPPKEPVGPQGAIAT